MIQELSSLAQILVVAEQRPIHCKFISVVKSWAVPPTTNTGKNTSSSYTPNKTTKTSLLHKTYV